MKAGGIVPPAYRSQAKPPNAGQPSLNIFHMIGTAEFNDSSLAILAHELREPLASILFAAQSMTEIPSRDPASREMWGVVERQGSHLSRIIEQVLELSRGAHDKLLLRKDWFDLTAAMVTAAEAVQALVARRGHRLTMSLPPGRVYVLADAVRVRQVVINLLTNAAKYTEPGGRIDLALGVAGDRAVIEVRDNGAGITRELLPRVFDIFRQGGRPEHGDFSGLGIGLALVKSLVELHGGDISAHSDGAGAGSVFTVRLPGASPTLRNGSAETTASPGSAPAIPLWTNNAMADA